MIRTAVPTRYDRRAEAGRNNPLRAVVETEDGEEHEVYMKVSAMPEMDIEGLANEVLAACLAGDLRLPIMEPFIVILEEEWIGSIPDSDVQSMLRASERAAFASKAAGPEWRAWSPEDRLGLNRQDEALKILAFDAFVENVDRRPGNPNCLIKGNDFRIIDHESTFRLRLLIPPSRPWTAGGLNRLTMPDGHVFARKLKGADLDYEPVRRCWSDLSGLQLRSYLSALPADWASTMGAMEQAVEHLQAVRDRINDCINELKRTLV